MKPLKSTTALVMCLSLSIPGPLVAQGKGNPDLCGDDPQPPCMTELGNMLMPGKGKAKDLDLCEGDAEEGLPCRTEDGFMLVAGDSEDALETAEDDTAAEAEQPADETETAEDSAPEDTVADTEVAGSNEAESTTIEEDTTAETEQAPAKGEETEIVQAEDSGGVEMTEAPAEEEVAVETEAEASQEAETAEAETEVTTETEASAEIEVVENPEIVQEIEEGVVEIEEAAVGAAAAEVSTDGEVVEGVEVEEEAVTEDTARSADEDFETSASGTASASASSGGGDDGLSNFEKALLVGLGAVAVGSILNNGDEVVSNSGDRLVVRDEDGAFRVLKDDDALLRQPGSQVRTETFNDGSTRTTVTKVDGSKIVTIRAADGRVVRRARVFEDGSQIVLFDDTQAAEPVDVSTLPEVSERPEGRLLDTTDEDALRAALAAELARDTERTYSLRQIRQIRKVRELAPEIELDAITFASGSAAIQPSQAEELAALGRAMSRIIEERPGEVFLIEGHTDAVGAATYNLALSDRRAETVALALTEYFDVPPENMITQGYGEAYLKIRTLEDERANRRAAVRRITPLLRQSVASNN